MKPLSKALQLQLADTLQHQLIPWAGSGAPIALLDVPPQIIGPNAVTEKPGAALPLLSGKGQVVRVRSWRAQNLNSATIPMLGCIIDGEADLEVGVTQSICEKLSIDGKRWIVEMPKSSFFLVAPNTPISATGTVHWRRPEPEKAYSRMIWIQIHETGAYCHFNTSDKGRLWIAPHLFLPNAQIFPLAHNLVHEIQLQEPRRLPIIYLHLGLILEYILRSLLNSSQIEAALTPPTLSLAPHKNSQDERIQKMIEYINANLSNLQLSTDLIARRFHLSPAHLRRLFQRELGTSVMKFVARRRLEFAQQLLLESSFNIEQISRFCGYKYPSNFTNAFVQHYGISPSDYRHSAQNNVPKL